MITRTQETKHKELMLMVAPRPSSTQSDSRGLEYCSSSKQSSASSSPWPELWNSPMLCIAASSVVGFASAGPNIMAWYLQNMPECLPCIGSSKRWDFDSIRSFHTPPTAPPRKTLPGIINSISSCKHRTLPNVSEDRKRTILLLFILLIILVNQCILQEVIIILTHIATAASGGWGSRGGRRSFLLLLFCTKILSNEMEVQLFCALLLNKRFGAL